jgi:hypothetical protein
MFEIPEVCEFQIGADQVRLSTQTNGDSIELKRLNFNENQAAALAYLINKSTNHLNIEVKEIQ